MGNPGNPAAIAEGAKRGLVARWVSVDYTLTPLGLHVGAGCQLDSLVLGSFLLLFSCFLHFSCFLLLTPDTSSLLLFYCPPPLLETNCLFLFNTEFYTCHCSNCYLASLSQT